MDFVAGDIEGAGQLGVCTGYMLSTGDKDKSWRGTGHPCGVGTFRC
jgi:hypothetical protein